MIKLVKLFKITLFLLKDIIICIIFEILKLVELFYDMPALISF